MGLTEDLFGSDAEKFTICVENKIKELSEKHKNFLSEQNIDLISDSYIISYGQSGSGRIRFFRTRNISAEIDAEIDKILSNCAEQKLQKL
ncbi:hypothetical protein [Chryseobacterium sp. RLHN22]|uniref:hypothetical protein n=1 Tax=Chryseobacterium sp. RLHN22 TaxID=3437885 RepID=UPI003D9BAE8D